MYLCAPGYVDELVVDTQELCVVHDVHSHTVDVPVIEPGLEVGVCSGALREGP